MENGILKKFKSKGDGMFFGWGSSPDADWKVILVGTFILIILATAWNAFTFMKVNTGDFSVFGETSGEESALLDINALKNAVSYYETKAVEFRAILDSNNSGITDPSI